MVTVPMFTPLVAETYAFILPSGRIFLSMIGHCIELMGVENSDDGYEGCNALDDTR